MCRRGCDPVEDMFGLGCRREELVVGEQLDVHRCDSACKLDQIGDRCRSVDSRSELARHAAPTAHRARSTGRSDILGITAPPAIEHVFDSTRGH